MARTFQVSVIPLPLPMLNANNPICNCRAYSHTTADFCHFLHLGRHETITEAQPSFPLMSQALVHADVCYLTTRPNTTH